VQGYSILAAMSELDDFEKSDEQQRREDFLELVAFAKTAKRTIEVWVDVECGVEEIYPLELFRSIKSEVRKRCIISHLNRNNLLDETQRARVRAVVDVAIQNCWEVRFSRDRPSEAFIVVDGAEIIVSDLEFWGDVYSPSVEVYHLRENPDERREDPRSHRDFVRQQQKHFSAEWKGCERIEGLPEQIISFQESPHQLAVASEKCWDDLIRYFARNPMEMRNLPPRKFEEFIRELIEKDGMSATLTPPSKDGGRDILASVETRLGRLLYLVECKRYSEKKPVGVEIVRSLYGVVEAEKATAGMIVTTSRFTKGSLDFSKSVENRMSLKDYCALGEWVKSHCKTQ
jgi:hypothetical protein